MGALVINDHWLKPRLGTDPRLGVATGKLSDVAGLVFFPLALVSVLELARWIAGSRVGSARGPAWPARPAEVAGAAAVTGIAFAAVQVVPAAAAAYAGALAALRWLPGGLAAVLTAAPLPSPPRIHHVMDVTDCLSLPALWLSYRVGAGARREQR
jgi:hypothetical protein